MRYEATGDDGLLIVAREKSNGPPFIRFGLDISNEALDLAVDLTVPLRVSEEELAEKRAEYERQHQAEKSKPAAQES